MDSSNHLPVFQPGQICSTLPLANADSFHPPKSEPSPSGSMFSESSALFSSRLASSPSPFSISTVPTALLPIRNPPRTQPSPVPYPSPPSTGSEFKRMTSFPQLTAADTYGGILDSPYVLKHHPLRLQAPPSPPPTIPTPTQDLPPTNNSPWILDDVLMDDDSSQSDDDHDTHDAPPHSAAPAPAPTAHPSAASSASTLQSSRLSPIDTNRNDSNALLSPLTSEWEAAGISDLAMSPIPSPMLASSFSGAFAALPLRNKGSVLLTTPNITFSGWDPDDALTHSAFFPFLSPPASPLSDFQGQARVRCPSSPLSITPVGNPPGIICPEGHHLRMDLTTPHVYHIPTPTTTQPSLLVDKQEESANTASSSTAGPSPTSPRSPETPTTPPDDKMHQYQNDHRLADTQSDGGSVAGNSNVGDSDIDTGSVSSLRGLFYSSNDAHSKEFGTINDSGHSMSQPFESLFHRPPLDFDDGGTYECPSSPASFGHLHSPLPPEDEEMEDQGDTILLAGLTNEPISLLNWDDPDDVGGMDDYTSTRLSSRSISHPTTTSSPPSLSLSASPVSESSPHFTLTTLPGAETDEPFELAPLIFPSNASATSGARSQLARSQSDPEKKDSMFFHPSLSMSLRAMSFPFGFSHGSAHLDSLGLDLGPSNRHNRGSSSISTSSSSTPNPPRSPSPEAYYLDPNVIAEHATDQPELDRLYEIRIKAQEAEREARRWESLANATAARGVKSGSAAYPGYPDNAWATPWSFGSSNSSYRSPSGWSPVGGGMEFGWNSRGEPFGSGLGLSGVGVELSNLGPAAATRCAQEAGRVRRREKEKCREVSTFLRLKLSERGVRVGPQATRSPTGGDESIRTKRKGRSKAKDSQMKAPTSPPAPHATPHHTSSKKLHASISTMEQLVARMFLRRNEMQMQRSPGSNTTNVGFVVPPGLTGSGSSSSMGTALGTSATGSGSSGAGEKKFGPVKSPLRQCILPEDLETQEMEDEGDTSLNREKEREGDRLTTKEVDIKGVEMDIDHTVSRTIPTAPLDNPLDSSSSLLSLLSSSSALSSANFSRFGSKSSLPSICSALTALPPPSISPLLDLASQDMQLDHSHHRIPHSLRDLEGSGSAFLPDMDLETEPDSLNLSLFGF